jgi:hypothetical protein
MVRCFESDEITFLDLRAGWSISPLRQRLRDAQKEQKQHSVVLKTHPQIHSWYSAADTVVLEWKRKRVEEGEVVAADIREGGETWQ